MPASTPLILHKSRMRRRARTDPSGGRSVMSVPTGTVDARGIAGVKRAYGAKLCDYFRAAVFADAGG
jgi:hypothetical protein